MYQIVLTTCPNNEVARLIANHLVTEKLAACVNIIGNVTSVYRWQGELACDQEVQLIIKTESALFEQLNARILQLHPYDVAEVIALNIQQGNNEYLRWISQSLK